MRQKAMGFIGTARELGEFLKRVEEAAKWSGDITEGYFYGYASRAGTVHKGGGFVDFEELNNQESPVFDLETLRVAG
jgi:hypothetical protein